MAAAAAAVMATFVESLHSLQVLKRLLSLLVYFVPAVSNSGKKFFFLHKGFGRSLLKSW